MARDYGRQDWKKVRIDIFHDSVDSIMSLELNTGATGRFFSFIANIKLGMEGKCATEHSGAPEGNCSPGYIGKLEGE